MAPPSLRIGAMLEAVQVSDIVGADILGNLSAQYVRETSAMGLSDFSHHAPEMEFICPATTLEPIFVTPGIKVQPTHTYDDAPRELDILLIGGPMLTHRPEAADRFMKETYPKTKIVMTTCVGAMWLASSGVMNGTKATTNRECLPIAKQLYPDVEWLDQRWVIDSKQWTSGRAGAGVDMMATYALENFGQTFVWSMGLKLLYSDPIARGQFYKDPSQWPQAMLEQDWKRVFAGGDRGV
ncbi:hypothetical protein W97_04022 [Coniosporium apollinis CBS 100218]|uniref:DJ-1/PfpI domain-containing protein n=1 Tax=Coniosporium apollinis (strain CBS 100218) TaxID=1168221 RepID=R7YSI4_CONA1|nr:uncharacterized protein W97_04022 [Coniosporium apollinis CBS 100218]EON64789.1 hypothetical protein W97_04022 [Coniosporium apollinis CBS 100218]